VGREGGLNLRFFSSLGRSMPFHRPKPPQLAQRNDGGRLPAEVDYLVRLGWLWTAGRARLLEQRQRLVMEVPFA
jgi:hypothetical protein